jgi:hypothetical protein
MNSFHLKCDTAKLIKYNNMIPISYCSEEQNNILVFMVSSGGIDLKRK